MDNHASEHRNGDIVRIRELHQLLDGLETRLSDRMDRTETRLTIAMDRHERDHERGARSGQATAAIVVSVLALLLSAFLGVLQILA